MMRRFLRIAAVVSGAVVLAVAALLAESWASFGGKLEGARLERARRSPQFHDGKFINPMPTRMLSGTYGEMFERQFFGKEQRVPPRPIPVAVRTGADYATPPASGLRATWIGHASVLVEIDGARVLTDPIWSDRASPSRLAGPRRFHPPPIALEALPHIDAVVISHDHFDHLDMATVRALAARGARFAVPLGIGAHLESWGIPLAQIDELDWGESAKVAGLTLTSTPARHYSGRNPLRGNRTLWTSWVIQGPVHRVYFSGDTGYSDGFARIGERYGPFILTLLKIGASDPSWQEIHMSPEEAVRAHVDLRGQVMLPVHWGTFNLAYHDWNQPPEAAVAAAAQRGVTLVVPRPGQLVEPSAPPPFDPWWR